MRISQLLEARAKITPNTIHRLADRKGVKWDNDPAFLRLTRRLTGKSHLDDLDQEGLARVRRYLNQLSVEDDSAAGKTLAYTTPNLDYEWEEAQRYPIFARLGLEGWKKLPGKQVNVRQLGGLQKIGNHTAPDQTTAKKEIQNLEQDKVKRMRAMLQQGQVELPIVVKLPDGKRDLLGGNTRFTGLVALGISPDVWYIDASNLEERFAAGENPRVGV